VTPPFERIAVMGLGLLGGSVALAARERGLASTVVGISRGRDTAALARERGLVDEAVVDPAAGVAGADLLVLATPVFAMADSLEKVARHLEPRALVTDVGSVKGPLAETLPGLLERGAVYVGAHPMAGGHESGLLHARADLFEGAPCVVTPVPGSDAHAVERVRAFWSGLGADVVLRDPTAHDEQVAWISHTPHVLAFAFARALEAAGTPALELRGSGFRDFTRIALSEPELWADILHQNRKALAGPLQAVGQRLLGLGRVIESGEVEGLERFIAAARENLARGADDAPSGGEIPEIQAAKEAATKE